MRSSRYARGGSGSSCQPVATSARPSPKITTTKTPHAANRTNKVVTDPVDSVQTVTKRPVTQVRAVGTKVEQPEPSGNCDPNYSGCVPIASDVDCAGGSGNGPAYVAGPVRVIGTDVFGLDRDHDGIGCED
jgi:resuscitation-promoting factor RpfB